MNVEAMGQPANTNEAEPTFEDLITRPLDFAEALPMASPSQLFVIEQQFPLADRPLNPVGRMILVQDRSPRTKIGSVLLPALSQDKNAYVETVGRVIAIGPLGFVDELGSGDDRLLPGAPWYRPGHFVWLPKYSSMRIRRGTEDNPVIFRLLDFKDVLGVITSAELVLAQ